jgi:predicted DNA-binding transcriptional regulator AlpA
LTRFFGEKQVLNATHEKDRLLTTQAVAELLDVSPQTLEVWRCTKRYNLAYVKIGRNVRYPNSAILAFIASRTIPA